MAAYKFRNDKGLMQNVELMLNNEERSDTVFLVNNARYHALSHLVAMNSTVLEALMNEYFAHCEDREIKIRNVKHEDSFYLVLQYMYGVQMNFTKTNINIICEALSLAERFEMADFSKELKQFVSTKIDGFDIESVVSLLNTSRKYNLNDLYKKVSEYAYKNAEQLVKHASFIQLQYEVLVDLLQSDWFFAEEIEILRGVLTWYDNMDVKRGEINADETMSVKDNVIKSLLSHVRAVRMSGFDLLEAFRTDLFIKYKDILTNFKHLSFSFQPREYFVSHISSKQSKPVSVNTNHELAIYNRLFNELLTLNKMYLPENGVFTLNRLSPDTIYKSEQEMQIGSFKLKVDLKESLLGNNSVCFDINLTCTSHVVKVNWECYTSGSIYWRPKCNECLRCVEKISGKPLFLYHSSEWSKLDKYLEWSCTFTSNDSRTRVGEFKLDLTERSNYENFVFNNVAEKNIKLELNVSTFQIKKFDDENPIENQEVNK